jgi:hypothetical protein
VPFENDLIASLLYLLYGAMLTLAPACWSTRNSRVHASLDVPAGDPPAGRHQYTAGPV